MGYIPYDITLGNKKKRIREYGGSSDDYGGAVVYILDDADGDNILDDLDSSLLKDQ